MNRIGVRFHAWAMGGFLAAAPAMGQQASGTLSANPNPCQAAAGKISCSTTLTWSTLDSEKGGWIWVRVNDAEPEHVALGVRGSQTVDWIVPGNTYVFTLYGKSREKRPNEGARLDEVTVTGTAPGAPPAESRAPLVSIGSVLGAPDETVDLPISLYPGAKAASIMQFEMSLPPSGQYVSIAPGPAAKAADKDVVARLEGSSLRIVVFGINRKSIPPGVVAIVRLHIPPTSEPRSDVVPSSRMVLATPDPDAIPTAVKAGAVTVEAESTVSILAGNFDGLRVYPSPWRSDLNALDPITFDTIPSNSVVRIFTIAAHHVKTLRAQDNRITWDLTNESGDKVASGVYLYVIDADGQRRRGKFAIVK